MTLALFDLDNTLIAGDSDYAWGQFIVEQGVVDRAIYEEKNRQFYEDYVRGELDVLAYLKFALEPLTQLSVQQRDSLHQRFMQEKIQGLWLPKAQALVDWHRQQNHLPVVITSTNRFITAPIVAAMGIEHLIASEPEVINGHYTGSIIGTPCYREGKIDCLQTWCEQQELPFASALKQAWFYSDSLNDLPLLEKVAHPVAVDADPTLKKIAESRGWPSISLR